MSTGIIRRGKNSWRINYDLGRNPATGKRERRFVTFRGTKEEAKAERIRILHGANRGSHVDASKVTMGEFLDRWDRDWASLNLSPKTVERHRELVRLDIKPYIGDVRLQRLQAVHLVELYAKLQREGRADGKGGLSPRTVGHVHRVLHRAMGHAVAWKLVQHNVVSQVAPPTVPDKEIAILEVEQMQAVLRGIKDRPLLYRLAVVAVATGLRLGEILGLRWRDINFDNATLTVAQSVEQTQAGRQLRIKEPKTLRGRRNLSVAVSVATELRDHWKEQQEARLALGIGKALPDDLVFATENGGPLKPNWVSSEWPRIIKARKLPRITFHGLRHTHASQLIASGSIDPIVLSRRIGHSKVSTTMDVYGHLFENKDRNAADVVEAAFGKLLSE